MAAPGIHTVVVKRAIGFSAAALLHPDEASDRIEQEVPKSLADREAIQPLRFDGPVLLEVDVLRVAHDRTGAAHTGNRASWRTPDFATAYRVTQLIIMLGGI